MSSKPSKPQQSSIEKDAKAKPKKVSYAVKKVEIVGEDINDEIDYDDDQIDDEYDEDVDTRGKYKRQQTNDIGFELAADEDEDED